SRNDQVATDTRSWLGSAIMLLFKQIGEVQRGILDQAKQHVDTLMPGYTHLRAAQPITAGHWLMSTFWMLTRDVRRFEACRESTLISPLGSGALAGNPYPIDRLTLAKEIGFHGI